MNAATKLTLPTHKDLPDSDGMPMQNLLQPFQIALLTAVLRPIIEAIHPDGRYLIGEDAGIYYRLTDPRLDGCKAPDWFYVGNVDALLDGERRRSYVLWQERTPPTLVVEFPSGDGSEEHDQTPDTGKFWAYEQGIQAPYYAIFDVDTEELEVFELVADGYHLMAANEHGRYPLPPLGVELGAWQGAYANYTGPWLRAYRPDGTLLPTPEEMAEQERKRGNRLAAKLRELNVDPESV
jgi:Uma2 family endonuclease